jgi:O-antigen/teichoic acid export membrane protein
VLKSVAPLWHQGPPCSLPITPDSSARCFPYDKGSVCGLEFYFAKGYLIHSSIERLRHSVLPGRPKIATDDSRGADRHRRALLTGATGITARAVSVGISVITVPLTLHYLGVERFGLWMTISAVLAMANFADFGVGNGVLNTVAAAFGKDDLDGVRRAISSGFAVLTGIGVGLLAMFLISYCFVPWADLFRVTSHQARAEAGPAMAVFVVCFALNIPLDVVQRVQLGLQQGFRSNIWQVLSSMMALAGVLAAIHFRLGLPALVMALAGAPILGTAMNALYFFGISRRDLLPQWHFVSSAIISRITRLGGLFFVLQFVAAISFSADSFIVARTLGAADVAMFSIPQRLFTVIAIPVTMLLVPFWPAYGEASSRGDITWIRRTLARTLLGVFALTSAASAALLLASNRIILWWVGPQIHPPFALLLGFAVWTVISCCSNTLGVFLNGASIVKFQVITTGIFGIGCLAIKILFARRYGVIGVPWATTIAFAILSIPPYIWYVPRLLRKMAVKVNEVPMEQFP